MAKKTQKRSKHVATRSSATKSKKKQPNVLQRLLGQPKALLIAVFFLVFGAIGVKMVFFSQAATFQLVGVHPQAALQPASGKGIGALGAFNGKVYAGFGDWNANTGPIALTPLDPATSTFASTPEFMADTEAISVFRNIGGKMYIPSTDPRINTDVTIGEVVNGKTQWRSQHIGMTHVFDIATLNGNDLYLVGSSSQPDGIDHGQVWKSDDGGNTWSLSLDALPATAGNNILRFTFVAPLNGKLYVQGYEYATGATSMNGQVSYSWVFDGARWSKVNASSYANLTKASSFNGKVLVRGMGLMTFDGKTAATLIQSAHDYSIGSDGYVYVLGTNSDGTYGVQRSNDLSSWVNVTAAPRNAKSILVDDHYIYLGTYDGEIYRADLNQHDSDTTPPAVSVVLPTSGVNITGSTKLQASASDTSGINKVEFYVGGTKVGSSLETNVDGSGPYYQSYWDGYGVPAGPNTLTAVAYDTYGNRTTSTPVSITVSTAAPTDVTGPSITITNPTPTTRIGKTVAIYSNEQDPSGVKMVTISLDGVVLTTTYPSTLSTQTAVRSPSLTKGNHTITVNAVDKFGNQNTVNYTFKK